MYIHIRTYMKQYLCIQHSFTIFTTYSLDNESFVCRYSAILFLIKAINSKLISTKYVATHGHQLV